MEKIFVFGSNEEGIHRSGAAKFAIENRGAIFGQAFGLQGNSFAIPTKRTPRESLPLEKIEKYVQRFLILAKTIYSKYEFYVTPIGCGLAGYTTKDIAPFFKDSPPNVELPEVFKDEIKKL